MPRTWIFSSAPKRGCLSKSGETGYRTGICVILSSIMENHALCGARGGYGSYLSCKILQPAQGSGVSGVGGNA